MVRLFAILVLSPWAALAAAGYELAGTIEPPAVASVAIYGSTAPYFNSTHSDSSGRFVFRGLAPGTYTVAVDQGARGEVRQTVEVGPGTANKQRVQVAMVTRSVTGNIELGRVLRNGGTVSAKTLAIPPEAWSKYAAAQRALAKPDVAAAIRNLQDAVARAPQFMAAWNELGTIAYHEARYADAEANFRRALEAEPDAFEPLVNLGGVLLNLARPAEALEYNRQAVARRPNDALANSQLGMAELATGDAEAALQHLETAKRIDPAHFSHPQLLLAQIHLHRGERAEAKAELEDFVKWHPDAPETGKIHDAIARMKP